MVRFVILRHGFSEYNKEKRYSGQLDVSLEAEGIAQAQCAAQYILENYTIDSIYSSDLSRAVETARPVAEALGLPIIRDKDLREVDMGQWHGMLSADVKAQYPEELRQLRENPGPSRRGITGENDYEVRERCVRAIRGIARDNEGKTVLIASHGGAIRSICGYFRGLAVDNMAGMPVLPNVSITVVDYDLSTETAQEIMYGFNGHLDQMRKTGEAIL